MPQIGYEHFESVKTRLEVSVQAASVPLEICSVHIEVAGGLADEIAASG